MPLECIRLYYSGEVQGVGFRWTAQRVARSFGLSGFARNLVDGRVEVLAQGEGLGLKSFLQAIASEFEGNIQGIERIDLAPDPSSPREFIILR